MRGTLRRIATVAAHSIKQVRIPAIRVLCGELKERSGQSCQQVHEHKRNAHRTYRYIHMQYRSRSKQPNVSFLFECPNSPDVPSKVNAEVATDATRLGSERLSLTKHLAALLDHILSLPAHTNDGSRRKKFAQIRKEALRFEILIMSLGHFKCWPHLHVPYTSLEEEVRTHE